MKELDFTKAKYLKLWLTKVGNYHDYQVKGTTDICTLARMCIWAGVQGLGKLFLVALALLTILILALTFLSALSYFTVVLPETYQVPIWLGRDSLMWLVIWLVVSLGIGLLFYSDGDIKMFPEYMKSSEKGESEKKEKTPSPTWIAIKEMYKSFKNKTCMKVKL